MSDRFSIAHVTPYPWEGGHEVNRYVERLSALLAQAGHRVAVVAPSTSSSLVRDSRRAIAAAGDGGGELLPESGQPPRLLAVGDVLPVGSSRRGARSLPVDVARSVEEALGAAEPDFVHVHEPFAPSTSSAALRHSRALNVGSFHAPTERVLATQVARRVVELFFGRLDARTASFAATAELMARFFPADYRVVMPGADAGEPAATDGAGVRIAFAHREERPALRLFLRALRRLPMDEQWSAAVWSRLESGGLAPMRREVRERLQVTGPDHATAPAVLDGAQVAVFASAGTSPAPGLLLRAIAGGAVPLAARLPVYEEILGEGERGLLFEPGDLETMAAQLTRLVCDAGLRTQLRERSDPLRDQLSWEGQRRRWRTCTPAWPPGAIPPPATAGWRPAWPNGR